MATRITLRYPLVVLSNLLIFVIGTSLQVSGERSLHSLLASPGCDSSVDNARECNVVDRVTVTVLDRFLQPAGWSLFLSGLNDDAALVLENSSLPSIILAEGAQLELRNLRLVNVFGSISSSTILHLDGIELSIPSADLLNTSLHLVVSGCFIEVECSEWDSLQRQLCAGEILADAEVHGGVITVTRFEGYGMLWENVTITTTACSTEQPMLVPPCAVRVVTDGSQLMINILQEQMPAAAKILLLLAAPLIIPMEDAEIQISAHVTILGLPVTSQGDAYRLMLLDCNRVPSIWRVMGSGTLTFRNVMLINMPTQPSQYPNGLLTSLMWSIHFDRPWDSGGPAQLFIINSDMLVILAELKLLQRVLVPKALGWVVGPLGFMDDAPSAVALSLLSNRGLMFNNATGGGGQWQWTSVFVTRGGVDLALDQYLLQRTWAGLSALIMPNETLLELPLSLIAPLSSSSMDLSVFNVAPGLAVRGRPVAGSAYGATHMIMTQNSALPRPDALVNKLSSFPNLSMPARVMSDTLIVGDPVRPSTRLLDLSGLAWISKAIPSSSYTGYVTVGGIDASPNTKLMLRNMVLYNLQAIDPCPAADPGQVPSIAHEMCNYTSLLWLFNINRDVITPAGSSASLLGHIVLDNVTLVLPRVELLAILQLLTGERANITETARGWLMSKLQKMQASAKSAGKQIEYVQIIESDLSSELPGSITFPIFYWFGMSGTGVTLMSMLPKGAGLPVPYLGVIAGVGSVGSALGSQDLINAGAAAASGALEGWRLGVTIVGAVVVATVVALLALLLVFRRKYGRWPDRHMFKVMSSSSGLDGAISCGTARTLDICCPEGRPSPFNSLYLIDPSSMADKHDQKAVFNIPSSRSNISSMLPSLNSSGGSATPGAVAVMSAVANKTETREALHKAYMHETAKEMALALLGPQLRRNPSLAEGRMATQQLMEEIFVSVRDETMAVKSASLVFDVPYDALEPAGGSRLDMHRQMDAMRREVGVELSSQWELQGQLGKGAHGVVYKGMWRGMQVAIKRSIFQVMGDPKAEANRKSALREAAINASLDHPNIVRSYTYDMQPLGEATGAGQQFLDWQLFIVQEYCNGGTLLSAIQQRWFWDAATGSARMEHILSIASHMAAGCAYIHSKQIIHGDLKPDNVLLKLMIPADNSGARPSCVVKVADFGMSMRIQANQTHVSGIRNGTPLYIAPEILSSSRASKHADVYSFGVMLWELYFGITAWDKLLQTIGAEPKKGQQAAYYPGFFSFSSCTVLAYKELGEACVSEDPYKRPNFTEVQQVLTDLQAALATSPIEGLPLLSQAPLEIEAVAGMAAPTFSRQGQRMPKVEEDPVSPSVLQGDPDLEPNPDPDA